MGTTYAVTHTSVGRDLKESVDSVLLDLNQSVSTYIPDSEISLFNMAGVIQVSAEGHFARNYSVSKDIWNRSGGAFDPTVSALVNAWGFGWQGKAPVAPSDSQVDSLMAYVGLSKIATEMERDQLVLRAVPRGVTLDFSAVAKGYGVDAVATLLEDAGVESYFVEIGGEVRTKGKSPRGDNWIAGISNPKENAAPGSFFSRLGIETGSLATSGNYRNYYYIDSVKVWHTIDPTTGRPEVNPVLSASIVTYDSLSCIHADALATACMVMGVDSCFEMIAPMAAEAYLLVHDEGEVIERMTPGFSKYLIKQ